MSTNDFNPYPTSNTEFKPESKGGGGTFPLVPRDQLEYTRMVSFVFENPKWFTNLLLIAVCNFIPIIGPLVWMGYQYEVVACLLLRGSDRYPDFDFNRFMDYLTRGLWPFLVALVGGLICVPVVMAFVFTSGFVVAGTAAGGEPSEPPTIAVFLLMGLVFVVMTGLSFALALVLVPMQIRAGLSKDFAAAFNFQYVTTFLSRLWKELLLGMLFLAGVGLVASAVGFLIFCIGIYLAMGVMALAQAHFYAQLLSLYVTRGGEPFPIVPPQETSSL